MSKYEKERFQRAMDHFLKMDKKELFKIFIQEHPPNTPAKHAFWLGCRHKNRSPYVNNSVGHAHWKAGRKLKQELESMYATQMLRGLWS